MKEMNFSLEERINFVINNNFVRITYTEAFEILKTLNQIKKENLNFH